MPSWEAETGAVAQWDNLGRWGSEEGVHDIWESRDGTHEPPLLEGVVLQRRLGTVIIWERFHRNVEAEHALVPKG